MLLFEEIVSGISLLKTPFCGAWSGVVLIEDDKNVLIDSGASTEVVDSCIVPALKAKGLVPDDIDFLLNTHSHGDHIGGHFRFKEISKAKIATHHNYIDKMRDPLKYNKLIRADFPKYSPPPSASLKGLEPHITLSDNEVLAGRLRLIHTAGHDDDCVCWFDEKTKTLISGDSLQANGTVLQGVGFYQDLKAYRDSIKKLLTMDIENIIAGHDYLPCGALALGKDSARKYLENCFYLTETYDNLIRKFLNNGITELPELAKALVKHIGGQMPEYLFLPLYTVREHLKESDAQ